MSFELDQGRAEGGRFCRCDDEGGGNESSEEKARLRRGNSGETMECG